MTKETKRRMNTAPTWWPVSLDTEPAVKSALGLCNRNGIDVAGSQLEKRARELRDLAYESYCSGGNVEADRKRIAEITRNLEDRGGRRAIAERQGKLDPDEWDRSTASLQENIAGLRRKIDAAAGTGANQKKRWLKVVRLRAEAGEAESRLVQYKRQRLTPPPELEDRCDLLADQLAAAEAAFDAGAARLKKIGELRVRVESDARRTLARLLRERVLPPLAECLTEGMSGLVARHRRRPDRPLPVEVRNAMRKAETVCALSDKLTGEALGIAPFLACLDEDTASVLYPRPATAAGHLQAAVS